VPAGPLDGPHDDDGPSAAAAAASWAGGVPAGPLDGPWVLFLPHGPPAAAASTVWADSALGRRRRAERAEFGPEHFPQDEYIE